MNIIFKSFDGDPSEKVVLEVALGGRELGTCISIANEQSVMPAITAKEHLWMPAGDLRAGRYPGLDWNGVAPIDEELIERMRGCEGEFMTMIGRYGFPLEMPYGERKRQYLEHLRYWNHVLTEKKIDLLLLNHPPHQGYDFVLYKLCTLRGIRTIYLERCTVVDAVFFQENWEEAGRDLGEQVDRLRKEFPDLTPVPLSENYEEYFRMYTEEKPEPYFMTSDFYVKHYGKESFLGRWWKKALKISLKNPRGFLRAICSPEFWSRKLAQHEAANVYYQHAQTPDFSQTYVYLPLHTQPEMSTSPLGGAFVDLPVMIELLAACLPPDVLIYVKEHPLQSERCRSVAFYERLLAIPSVRFVPKNTDTFALIEHAAAVATCTGTAGFQGLFRGKPHLMFGHRFFQFAPGVHRIRSVDDCRRAIKAVFEDHQKPALREMRMFLSAVESCSAPSASTTPSPIERYSQEEKRMMMGEKLAETIERATKDQ